jgi:DnaB-like helicase C terminal domain
MGKKNQNRKIQLDLNIGILDDMVRYIFSENGNVHKKSLVRMRELFEMLDESVYENDRQMEVRVFLINKLLEGKLGKRINNLQMLSNYCLGGQYDDEVLEIYAEIDELPDLSDEEVYFIDEYVSDRLEFSYIYNYEEDIDNMIIKLRSGDFNSLRDYNEEFEDIVQNLYNNMKQAKSSSKHAERDFNTNPDSLDSAVSRTITNLNRPSNRLKTGVKWLNKMLGGGYQGGRAYLHLGMPKGWKSGMLLNICLWAKHYNDDIVTKDPTKKPAILYVTQENSIDETLERVWSYYFGEETDINQYDEQTAMQMLYDAGFNDEGITIHIKYRPNKSISTADLDSMIDDLSLEGYECVMLVQDYIKRIRCVDKAAAKDIRLELGAVMDEMTVIAKTRGIPVVTASQMNREAAKVIEASEGKKANLAKQLGSSHAGESMLMIENADFVFVQAMEEKKSTGNKYLTLKLIAGRGKKGDGLTYFAHPFENGMKLEEDQNLSKTKSVLDLGDDLANFDPNNTKRPDDEDYTPTPQRSKTPSSSNIPTIRTRPKLTGTDGGNQMLANMEIEV